MFVGICFELLRIYVQVHMIPRFVGICFEMFVVVMVMPIPHIHVYVYIYSILYIKNQEMSSVPPPPQAVCCVLLWGRGRADHLDKYEYYLTAPA